MRPVTEARTVARHLDVLDHVVVAVSLSLIPMRAQILRPRQILSAETVASLKPASPRPLQQTLGPKRDHVAKPARAANEARSRRVWPSPLRVSKVRILQMT